MRSRQPHRPATPDPAGEDIDARYGLEPVFEPGMDVEPGAEGTQFERIECPYCGEPFETRVDLSAGSASYVEDCQVCCQPIEMQLEVGDGGRLVSLTARRGD
jgi:hypothetical protein